MTQDMLSKLLQLQDEARTEPEFQALCAEYQQRQAALLQALDAMPPDQRDAVFDFLGIYIEVQNKLLELAMR